MDKQEIKTPPAIFLMGPTCSGKTRLAVQLVERLPCSIISVDSALVYRGMNIGTAKPGPEVLEAAPHRLIDICDPAESYSAAKFRNDALKEMQDITASGRIPLLVGGTGLYFRTLQRGISELPDADPAIRQKLQIELQHGGLASMHRRLDYIDAQAAARIHPNDTQRILRALEVYEISGRTVTELLSLETERGIEYNILKIILFPERREKLHQQISERFTAMLHAGFEAEVAGLYERGDLTTDMPSMRVVGYRQMWEYLAGKLDYAAMSNKAIIATRQLAKRQLTWLRSEQSGHRLDSDDPTLFRRVQNLIRL